MQWLPFSRAQCGKSHIRISQDIEVVAAFRNQNHTKCKWQITNTTCWNCENSMCFFKTKIAVTVYIYLASLVLISLKSCQNYRKFYGKAFLCSSRRFEPLMYMVYLLDSWSQPLFSAQPRVNLREDWVSCNVRTPWKDWIASLPISVINQCRSQRRNRGSKVGADMAYDVTAYAKLTVARV